MKRNIGNIFVSSTNYEAVYEMYYKMKAKNISHVIDSIISNYLNIATILEKKNQEISNLNKVLQEVTDKSNEYRNQLLRQL